MTIETAPRGVRLRFLPIDDALASVAQSGVGAFAAAYGVRVHDFDFLHRQVVEPNIAHLRRMPRAAPFGAYLAVDLADSQVVGTCAFVAGPADRAVEIAYFTLPPFEGRGIATAMALELVRIARDSRAVDVVHAHTLREANASTRVLARAGFGGHRDLVHPEDGPVWRFELPVGA
ncbi:MAG: GNAT family N-acetyltransferase [Planctomycetota bacterium]|nr:GNAT family N-acetyltransferase [Planctomycetota bacterium]